MKLLALVAIALPGAAFAAPRDPIDELVATRATLLAALADQVDVGPIAWSAPACALRFATPGKVTGPDRDTLAGCLADLHLSRARLAVGSPVAAIGAAGAIIAIALRGGKIVGLDVAAPDRRDAQAPTVLRWWINSELVPSERTRAAIARAPGKAVEATFKVCHDDEGAVTSRRIVRGSAVAAFDEEALAYFHGIGELEPYVAAGKPIAACAIFAFRYPQALAGTPAASARPQGR